MEKEKDSNIENKKRQGRATGSKKTELTEEKKVKVLINISTNSNLFLNSRKKWKNIVKKFMVVFTDDVSISCR